MYQCIAAWNKCLLFIDIVDGNSKLTMGMIWTIILGFSIQTIQVEGK